MGTVGSFIGNNAANRSFLSITVVIDGGAAPSLAHVSSSFGIKTHVSEVAASSSLTTVQEVLNPLDTEECN
jgi:hypothetical protein